MVWVSISPLGEAQLDVIYLKGFKVFALGGYQVVKKNRKDFYKSCLVRSEGMVEYAEKDFHVKGTTPSVFRRAKI